MRQILCDKCGEVIDLTVILGDEQITFAAVAIQSKNDAYWGEYHRRCARQLTVPEVWALPGLMPL